MNALHPLISRFLALALLGMVVLMAVVVFIASPVAMSINARAELVELQRQLVLFQQRITEAAHMERVLTQNDNASLSELFYSTPTPALAAAQLQSDLRRILTTQGVLLRTTEMPGEVRSGDFVQVSVQGSFDAPFDGLASFLDQVQRSPRLIRFRSLDIRVPGSVGADAKPVLSIRFDAYAYAGGVSP